MSTGTPGGFESSLAEFVSSLSIDDPPSEAIEAAERAFVDTVGVILAGADAPPGRTAPALSRSRERDAVAILGDPPLDAVPEAGLALATAAHSIDYDDSSPAIHAHPSAVLVPATLSLAGVVDASGADAVAAYVAGFEAQHAVAGPINAEHYRKGWHATGTLGTFGAAAAAARLLGLDSMRTRHALNAAASMPSGLKSNFGTMTKPLHAGLAARSGLTAAMLAGEGFTAGGDAISGPGGFWELYGDGGHEVDVGEGWHIVDDGIVVKRYPCCRATHSAIAAAEAIAPDGGFSPEDVVSVTVRASENAADLLDNEAPTTGLEAKFSMHYTVAHALAHGAVTLDAFDDRSVPDPAAEAVLGRTRFEADPELPYYSHDATVRVGTRDGTFERSVTDPWGPEDDLLPVSDRELRGKFVECASRAVSDRTVEALYRNLESIADEPDLRGVLRPLAPE